MRKHAKLLAAGLVALLMAGTLAGCGSSGDGGAAGGTGASGGTGGADATSTAGDTLVFGCQNYSDGGIDPAQQTNCGWNYVRYGIGECLFKFDDQMNIEGWLAEDAYEVSDDHTIWTFHIRDDAFFSDGCACTPSAVKASIERLWDAGANGTSNPQNYLEREAVLEADDEAGTLTITTQTAYVDLRKNLAYPVMAIVDVQDTTDYNNGAIGTGPYAVSEYKVNQGYTLVKNEHYYEEVPFETVELMYLGDATAKANALRSGQIMVTENVATASDLNELMADDAYRVDVANGVRCGFSYMNMDGVLANDALREAIQMAVDGQTIADVTVGGLYTYGYSVLPSNLDYGYDELENPYAFDQEAAAAKLDEAGIVDTDGDGIREVDGQNVNLRWITYENRALSEMAQACQQQLAEVGIGVSVQSMSSDAEWNMMVNGEYDLCSSNWITVGTGDPTEYLANWDSDNEANWCNYANEAYDAAYNQLLTELDDDARRELIRTMQQCLIDDAAVLVHGYYNSSMISDVSKIASAPIHTADYYWLTTEIKPAA